jgi:hypothetical protein
MTNSTHSINNLKFEVQDETTKISYEIEPSSWTVSTARAREIWANEVKLVKNPLQDGAEVKGVDRCAQHNTPQKKQYSFGMNDATVTTFKGCKCAVTVGFMNDTNYFTSYEKAQSLAKYTSMRMATF